MEPKKLILVEQFAKDEIKRLVSPEWRFQWDWQAKRFGLCDYRQKLITMSMDLAGKNTEDRFNVTLYHEIAHALCPYESHNEVWRAKAIELGSDGKACFDWKTQRKEHVANAVIPAKGWEVRCPEHGIVQVCFRMSEYKRNLKYSCLKCSWFGGWEKIR